MKRVAFCYVLFAAVAMLMAGCYDATDNSLMSQIRGSWRPIYAEGTYEDAVYIHSYAGPVDEHGLIPCTLTSKNNPDYVQNSTIMIPGRKFLRHSGKDCYLTIYFMDYSYQGDGYDIPLLCKIEDGKIYFEIPNSFFVNDADWETLRKYLGEGSGKFGEGMELTIIDRNTIRIGPVTYIRMR